MAKPVLTVAAVESKLRELNGNQAAVGRALGVTRQAVSDFIRRKPSLQPIQTECRESMVDLAESGLLQAIRDRMPWAIALVLKTLGKSRGYVERVENRIGGDPGAPPVKADHGVSPVALGQFLADMTMSQRMDAFAEAYEDALTREGHEAPDRKRVEALMEILVESGPLQLPNSQPGKISVPEANGKIASGKLPEALKGQTRSNGSPSARPPARPLPPTDEADDDL